MQADTVVLGVNSAYHESAACLLADGRIVGAVEEERFTRRKHAKESRVDNADELPWNAIRWCLAKAGLPPSAVGAIGYSFDPEARLAANLEHPVPGAPAGDFGTPEGERAFHASLPRARDALAGRFPAARFHLLPHHRCHAASAYLEPGWPTEFLLRAVPVYDAVCAQLIPAVVRHSLSTNAANSRIHVVRQAAKPRYHALLRAWKTAVGRGILLNTSFNSTEPIVCTPREAVATFVRSSMDLLTLGPYLVRRRAMAR
jgi:predicted NodU family carbamoyl transferase